jgi:hypothetical protein
MFGLPTTLRCIYMYIGTAASATIVVPPPDVGHYTGVLAHPPLEYSTFSGSDMQCAIFVPPQYIRDSSQRIGGGLKLFAELQTLAISSARTTDPVRVLGKSGANGYTRGPRTIAGTLIFTDIVRDALANIMALDNRIERVANAREFFIDQIPPFNIIIRALNEMGVYAARVMTGITLVNYGTTYSVDDMLTESQYTYVADTLSPFMDPDDWVHQVQKVIAAQASRLFYGANVGSSYDAHSGPVRGRYMEYSAYGR